MGREQILDKIKREEYITSLIRRFEEAVELRITEPGINSEQRYKDAKYSLRTGIGLRGGDA